MSRKVVIVDYGVGNLLSVARAFEYCGATVTLAEDSSTLIEASRLVLPGVGAFGDCITALRMRGLDHAVLEHVAKGRPLLGICVGMQMLLDASEEFGHHAGLGIIPGMVSAIPQVDVDGRPLKIPHIGWSPLVLPEEGKVSWSGTPLASLKSGCAAYFVHSFYAQTAMNEHRLADAIYGGHRVTAAVRRGTVFGTQFHPEKSGPAGLAIIRNFLFESESSLRQIGK
jgi:glutamine amidotransferase